MHIPLMQIKDRREVYRLLAGHPHTFSISAHRHTQAHHFITREEGWEHDAFHHHLVNATTCGSWWSGAPDEVGIPHATMSDGVPNGYSIITFNRNRYSIEFKAVRRPAGYQMHIFAPEEVSAAEAIRTEVLANVFAGSSRSQVEMRLGETGPWIKMEQTSREDPCFLLLKQAEASPNPPPGLRLPGASRTDHIWRATLPENPPRGTHLVHIRTTDMFGQTYTGQRVIRIRREQNQPLRF